MLKRFPSGVPLLNPEEDMKVEGAQFRKLVRRIEAGWLISTRSDPLYHKKLRGQIERKPQFVKMVDLRGSKRGTGQLVGRQTSRIRGYLFQIACSLW